MRTKSPDPIASRPQLDVVVTQEELGLCDGFDRALEAFARPEECSVAQMFGIALNGDPPRSMRQNVDVQGFAPPLWLRIGSRKLSAP